MAVVTRFRISEPTLYFFIYLYLRLQKLKHKYEINFKEKLTFYDKIEVSNSIIDNLNEIGQNITININFIKKLHYRIYNYM